MARAQQEASLRALVAGEKPAELVFDPITDNDSDRSCLGCLWSLVGSVAVLVGLDAADAHNDWHLFERGLEWAGVAGLALGLLLLALGIFCLLELRAAKEMYVLNTATGALELRQARGEASQLVQQWTADQVLRFSLHPPGEEAQSSTHACLFVMLRGEREPIRLLEACYQREFVVEVERALSALFDIPSTT